MATGSSMPLASARERRWLQFRLRTLLLIPLLLGLFCTFAGQAYDHFILLEASYGAVLGSLWAIGRIQIVGLQSRGLGRALPVIWAAICGGLTSGILVGPIHLLIAVKLKLPGPAMEDPLLSVLIAGAWLGAMFGALGGGIVGPLAAYLVHFRLQRTGRYATRELIMPRSSMVVAGAAEQREDPAGRKRQFARLAFTMLYVLVLAPPTVWLGYRLFLHQREQAAIRQSGIRVHAIGKYEGPEWLRALYPGHFVMKWFRRVQTISLSGPLSAAIARPLDTLTGLESARIEAAELEDADALLRALAGLTNPRLVNLSLDLSGSDVTAAGTRHFRRMTALTSLNLDRTAITDADLANLRGLAGLRFLSLAETSITGEGFGHLVQARLEKLDLSGTRVGDAGLNHLARTCVRGRWSLWELQLDGTEISDAGLAHLKAIPLLKVDLGSTAITDAGLAHLTGRSLQSLRLPNTSVTDAGAATLGRITSLWDLDLSKTGITDAALRGLPAMVRLHRLALDETAVTDAGLTHLERVAGLRELSLRGTAVTDDGVRQFKAARPELRVAW